MRIKNGKEKNVGNVDGKIDELGNKNKSGSKIFRKVLPLLAPLLAAGIITLYPNQGKSCPPINPVNMVVAQNNAKSEEITIDDLRNDLPFKGKFEDIDHEYIDYKDSKKGLEEINNELINIVKNYEDYLTKVKKLVNKDNINIKDKEGNPLLLIAIDNANLKVAKFLIENGADVNATNKAGDTALHIATRSGYIEIMKSLIERGAKVNAIDDIGCTPLHYIGFVLWTGYPEVEDMVKLLVNAGANIDAADKYGWTPIFNVVNACTNDGCRNPAKYYSAENIVKLFISKGAKLNIVDDHGFSLLHYLSSFDNSPEHVYMVVASEIKNTENTGNYTISDSESDSEPPKPVPFKVPSKEEKDYRIKIAKILIENGAKVDIKDGKTADGAPPTYPSYGSPLPIHIAAFYGFYEMVDLLIKNGNTDFLLAADDDGFTALHHVARFDDEDHIKVAKLLIEKSQGALLKAVDKKSKTPYDIAVESKNNNMAKILKEEYEKYVKDNKK